MPRYAKRRRRLSVIWSYLAVSAGLSGCSVNEFGLVDYSNARIDGAIAYKLSAFGAHLDTRSSPSLTFGFYEAMYVFPDACFHELNTVEMTGGEMFGVTSPQAAWRRISGIQIAVGRQEVGVLVGYREQLLAARFPANSSLFRKLSINTSHPESSQLVYSGGC